MEKIKLWENGTPYYNSEYGHPETTVTWYPAEGNEPKGCIIVCPGGGYSGRAPYEGDGYAEFLNEKGYHAFVLNYRVKPYQYPAEFEDVLRSIRFARYNAEKFGIDSNKIAIMGSSAGGHLAVLASEHFDYGKEDGDEIDRVSSRPDLSILCYPVVSLVEPYSHFGSRDNLLGNPCDEELAVKLSGEKSVRDDTPPTFIWHTFDDTCVPIENSLYYACALREKKIPAELHVFPSGNHGLGLAKNNPHVAQWKELLINWLKLNDF